MAKLPIEFYIRENVHQISKDLLGKILYTNINGQLTSGRIVETEAYMAPLDKASHAYNNRRTPRTENFYNRGGISYVYLCYGIHYLFNIITNKAEIPHAILIRALEPLDGIEIMLHRRKKASLDFTLTSGPGALSLAMGIDKNLNGVSLESDVIWIEEGTAPVSDVVCGPRVGVGYADEYALKEWRYALKGNLWVSRPKL